MNGKLGLRPRKSFSGNTLIQISLQCRAHWSDKQCSGSVILRIRYWFGSSILGWIPIWFRIRIQSGSRVFLTKNCTKFKAEKNFFWINNKIYLSLGLHKGLHSYKRSLQLLKANIQHVKTWNLILFLLFWVIFSLLDPDPDSEYGFGSGSADLIKSGSNPDPDPEPCSIPFAFQGATALSGWTRSRCLTWLARKKIT